MNTPLITMPVDEANKKLAAYQKQLRRRADEEYEIAAAGYAALAAGRPLLNLTDVFAQTGLGGDYRPRLAIARADRKQVKYEYWNNCLQFNALKNPHSFWSYVGELLIRIPFPSQEKRIDGYALVPMVPADVRPAGPLRQFFVLWEVEAWSDRPITAIPPHDPYLLQWLHGDLYIVVAEWDLTPLERSIMSGRRNT